MLRRIAIAVVLLASGCKHWKVLEEGSPNPLAGQTRVVVAPLAWTEAQIDGDPMSKWLAGQDEDSKKGWPGDQADAAAEYQRGLSEALAGGPLQLADAANPQGATLTLKPEVLELETGGRRPTRVTIAVSVVDAQGKTLERISTQGEWKNMFIGMNSRLKAAAEIAGKNLADYLKSRAR